MRQHASIVKVGVLFFLAVILAVCAPGPVATAQSASNAYFSSDQAVFDPQNQAKSQQQAIQNFMAQGLIQDMRTFLNPDQMGPQFEKLQKSVLAGPGKYVDSYQIYSEKHEGGEFQVIRKDYGLNERPEGRPGKTRGAPAKNTPAAPAASSPPAPAATAATPAPAAHPVAPAEAPAPVGANGQASQPKESQAPASPPAAATPEGAGQKGPESVLRGIRPTKKEILWAVVEKWDEKWVLPTDSGDIRCIFARSLARAMGLWLFHPPAATRVGRDGQRRQHPALSGCLACRGPWRKGCGCRQGFLHRRSPEPGGIA